MTKTRRGEDYAEVKKDLKRRRRRDKSSCCFGCCYRANCARVKAGRVLPGDALQILAAL